MGDHYISTMKAAHDAVRESYTSDIAQPDEDGIIDTEVGFDGMYMTQGHKSHICIGFVIDMHTNIVSDFEVVCNFCIICHQGRMTTHQCRKNFEGKSGAMEPEAAVWLWSHSCEHRFRYTTFAGDGNSSAFSAMCGMNDARGPYEDKKATKEECVNHISKRMGSHLRKIKEASVPMTTKTGRR